MSDDQFGLVLEAAADAGMLLAIVNAILAVGMMVRFPEARKSPWLWTAIGLPVFIMVFSPAIQSA
jgi:hypothetical protein